MQRLPKFILTFCNKLPLYRITKTLEKFKYRGKLRCRTRHFPEHRAFNAILATSRKTNLGSSGSEARLGWVLHTPPHVWAETSCFQTIERQGLSFLTEIGEKCKHFFFYFNLHFCLTLLDENWHPHTNIFGCPLEIPTMYKINYFENPTRH